MLQRAGQTCSLAVATYGRVHSTGNHTFVQAPFLAPLGSVVHDPAAKARTKLMFLARPPRPRNNNTIGTPRTIPSPPADSVWLRPRA